MARGPSAQYFRMRNSTTVSHRALNSLFTPGGSVYKKAAELGRETKYVAEMFCAARHNRTGEMVNKHGKSVNPAGPYKVRFTVHNDAPYAMYVIKGTPDVIESKRAADGGFMVVRPSPHSWYSRDTPRAEVRGQGGDNWMADAMDEVLRNNGIAF